MNDHLAHWLRLTAAALGEAGARFAVVGGLAVSARAEVRFTRDVDMAVAAAADHEAERLLARLLRTGFRPIAELDHKPTGRLATMRLAPPGVSFVDFDAEQPPVVDLLFATTGIEPEVVNEATPFDFRHTLLPVAPVPHLIAMKNQSAGPRRRKDELDLEALFAVATADDFARARQLTRLIVERGYHQQRDLLRELDERWHRLGPEQGNV